MTTAQYANQSTTFDAPCERPQISIKDAIKSTGIDRDHLYEAIADGRVRSTTSGKRVVSVDHGDVLALLGRRPQAEEPKPTPLRDQDLADYQSPGDRARATALLVGVVGGDRLGVTANVIAAQRADRVSATIQAVVAVAVEALPELRNTDVVDRLRAIVATPGVEKFDR